MIFRMGVGLGEEQAFVCECPYCNGVIRGVLRADQREVTASFESEDLAEVAEEDVRDPSSLRGVTVYTDLPVHQSVQGRSLAEGGSAFLTIFRFMGERLAEYSTRAQTLQAVRLELIPELRRAASMYVREDWDRLADALGMHRPASNPQAARHPRFVFLAVLEDLYQPLMDTATLSMLRDEVARPILLAKQTDPPRFAALMAEFVAQGFSRFRRQVAEVVVNCLLKFDALLPGLAYEHFSPEYRDSLGEFRIFRDDFDDLKTRYLEVFEVASRSLAYAGSTMNLARRSDSRHWADGRRASIKKMLRVHASDREFILAEYPRTGLLFSELSRHTRNDIGHHNVYYDFSTGCLVGDGTDPENFLLFLVDFLNAFRATAFLVILLRAIDEEIHR